MEVCPVGFFCFDKNTVMLLIISAIICVVFYINKNNKQFSELTNSIINNNSTMQHQLAKLKEQNNILNDSIEDKSHQLKKKSEQLESKLYVHNQIADEAKYLANKDMSRVIHPLVPPQRSFPYRINEVGIPVNVPTRGYSTGYQQVGILIENENDDKKDNKLLPLFGEQLWPGARQWRYYTSSDGYQSVKLPVVYKNKNCQDSYGCDEIYDGQIVNVQGYENKHFKANIYKLDGPRYIPYII